MGSESPRSTRAMLLLSLSMMPASLSKACTVFIIRACNALLRHDSKGLMLLVMTPHVGLYTDVRDVPCWVGLKAGFAEARFSSTDLYTEACQTCHFVI